MVATISKLHGGNATYYTKSYYLKGRADGEWLDTKASSKLRLAKQAVLPKVFERLLGGYHPRNGEGLVQNAGDRKRQLGWDIQFAVDKSFSVLYAMVREVRAELESCLKEAVRGTILKVLEPEFLETRRGKGGLTREGVSSPIATFLHRTNRDNEIHLHCHAPVPNLGYREDRTWGTIVSWNFYDAKLALGKAFHALFIELVTARLGIECELNEHGLSRVRGFPEPVAEALSSPSRKIAEIAEDDSAKAKEEANLKHRSVKSDVPLEVVEKECRRRAAELGFSEDDAREFLGKVARPEWAEEYEAAKSLLRDVVASLPQEFSKAQLFEHAFREGAKAGISFVSVNEAIKETLSDGETFETIGRISGKEQYRKHPEFNAEKAPLTRDEACEKEFRELLGQIIKTTPELNLAEFFPQVETSTEIEITPPIPSEDMISDSLDAALIGLGSSGGAIAHNAQARATLRDVLKLELEQEPISERSFESISLDTTSPALAAQTEAMDEAKRLENRWVHEVPEISETKARSLLGNLIERARATHDERLMESALTRALSELTKREAHFTRQELKDAAAEQLTGKILRSPVRESVLDRFLADPSRVLPLGTVREENHYTTPEMLEVEKGGLQAAEILQGRIGNREDFRRVEKRIAGNSELTAEERQAVAKALSGSDLVLIRGEGGLQMQAVQRGIREALHEGFVQRGIERSLGRKDLLWIAPTATAARELERSVGAEHVATLQKLIFNLDRSLGGAIAHHGSMMVNAALGLPTWEARQLALTPHTTVILESAGLADTRLVSKLLQHAEKVGARVIACGTHEMTSLGPGGFFRELSVRSREADVVTLSDASKRDIQVLPSRNIEAAKKSLIDRWAAEAMEKPRDHTIVGVTSRVVHDLNAMAQARRKEAGYLGFRSMEVRYKLDDQLVTERIYEGDRVVFTARNDKQVINGVFGTVKHIDLITGRIKVELDVNRKKILPWEFDRKQTVEFPYRKYRFFQRQEEGFRLGYAATVYRSQNVAVEGNSYCLLGGPDGAPSAVYAGLGLAKQTTYFFGDALEQRAERLEPKQTAHAVKSEARLEERSREIERAVEQRLSQAQSGQGQSMSF